MLLISKRLRIHGNVHCSYRRAENGKPRDETADRAGKRRHRKSKAEQDTANEGHAGAAGFVDQRAGHGHGRHGSASHSEQRQAESAEVGPEALLSKRDMRYPGARDETVNEKHRCDGEPGRNLVIPAKAGIRLHDACAKAPAISSNMVGSSIVAGIFHASPSAIFRMVPRRIFPERVLGSRGTTSARLNEATAPILSRIKPMHSCSMSLKLRSTPAFSTTKPIGTCPLSASLIPITAHSATSG